MSLTLCSPNSTFGTIIRSHEDPYLQSYLNLEVMLTTTVPKGIKLEVFVRVDNVVVIKLQDN